MFKLSGRRPKTLGLGMGGRLAPCPNKPNCVCSEFDQSARLAEDPHHVPPFRFNGDPSAVIPRLRQLIEREPRATVVTVRDDYLHAEFASRLMGFVDDVEFRVASPEKQVHVRSAARLGYSDFGVNRARVERLRELFEAGQ